MSTTQENQREIVFWRTLCLGGAGLYIASKVLSSVFATNNQAKLGRNSKVTPSSGNVSVHRNKVHGCDGGGGHWLDPKSGVIALGPAGGKSTLSADDSGGEGTERRKENEVVVDCEQYISWRQLKTDFNYDLENEKIRQASLAPSAVKSNTATSSSLSSSSSYWVRQQEEKKAAQENLPEGASSDPLRHLSPTDFFAPKSINWENEVDLTSLFFRGIVPVTMSCLVLGKVAAFNCVDSTSIILAGRFLKGLAQMMNHQSEEQGGPSSSKPNNKREEEGSSSSSSSTPPLSLLLDIPSVAVLKVEDSKELDRRIMQRGVAANFSSDHGGYAWHRQCHVLWQGVASEYSIPLLPTPPLRSFSTKTTEGTVPCDSFLSGPPHPSHLLVDRAGDRSLRSKRIQELLDSAQGGHHVCRFYSPELRKSFALIEVLPLQWGLYDEEVILEDDGDHNQKGVSPSPSVVHDLDLVGWYYAEYLPPPVGKKDTTSADHQKSGEEEQNQDPIQSLRRECKLALGEVVENDATVLVQSRYVARGWGRETPPYRAMALNPRSRTVTVISPGAGAIKRGDKKKTDQEQGHLISQTYPMAQTGLAGYNSNYLPTFHLNLREEDERLSLHKRISTLTRMGIRENGEGGLGPVRAKRSILPLAKLPASEERGERNASEDKRKKCIILYHGSFAPFHAGHKETLVVAKDELIHRGYDVLGAYLVPVAALWPKDTPLGGLRPWALRAAICQMCVADLEQQQHQQQQEEGDHQETKQSFKVAVDHAQGYPNVCVESLLQRIRAHFPEEEDEASGVVELVWVNGTDVGVTGYMEWLLREVPDVTLLWIPRAPSTSSCSSSSSPTAPPPPIEQNEDVIQITQALEIFARRDLEEEGDGTKGAWYKSGRAIVATHYLPTMSLSSTKVRRAIAEKQFSQAAEWIGNDAAAAYAFWAVHEMDDMGRTLPL